MMRAGMTATLALIAVAVFADNVAAQRAARVFPEQRASAAAPQRTAFLKAAKWSTLAGSSAALGYGIIANRSADRDYEAIERMCEETPDRCARSSTGAYIDADLEARYRDVLALDDRAKLALTIGQVGLAATLALFILDLPSEPGTEDIPYEPGRLRIGPRTDGSLQVGYRFSR